MLLVKIEANNRMTIPKAIISFLNMRDKDFVYVVEYDSETFFIKKQLDTRDTESSFISTRPIHRQFNQNSLGSYRISIPPTLMRKMPSIKIGGRVRVYVKNGYIVVTTNFSKKGE